MKKKVPKAQFPAPRLPVGRQARANSFEAELFRYPGPGGWTFARIPAQYAPPVTHGWGRTPVLAKVDGVSWETSVWNDKTYGTLLAVPKRLRGDKGDGDVVVVELHPSLTRP